MIICYSIYNNLLYNVTFHALHFCSWSYNGLRYCTLTKQLCVTCNLWYDDKPLPVTFVFFFYSTPRPCWSDWHGDWSVLKGLKRNRAWDRVCAPTRASAFTRNCLWQITFVRAAELCQWMLKEGTKRWLLKLIKVQSHACAMENFLKC